jgi:uncharacterized Zn finger protein
VARRSAKKTTSVEQRWRELTWDELEDWAGYRSVERGRDYQRGGQVEELAATGDGGLLAWVQGGQRYATHVWLVECAGGPFRPRAVCSCPRDGDCKHAVAVVLDYLEGLDSGRAVSVCAASDSRLRLLAEIEERQGSETRPAPRHGQEFFRSPCVARFRALLEEAGEAGWLRARRDALRFLETGIDPSGEASAYPRFDVLLDIAIEEKKPVEVLRWYDRLVKTRSPGPLTFGWVDEQVRVADAVAATHPERALVLYQAVVAHHLARATPSGYEVARPYLRKVKHLLEQRGRSEAWARYLAGLRATGSRKPWLLELLDRLEGGRILAG